MSTKPSSSIFATIFHVACGLGAVFVICDLLHLGTLFVWGVGLLIGVPVFILGAAWLYTAAVMTLERLQRNETK